MTKPLRDSLLTRLRRRKSLAIFLLLLIFCITLLGFSWHNLYSRVNSDYETEISSVYRENSNLVRAFADHLRQNLQVVDATLLFVKLQYENNGHVTETIREVLSRRPASPIDELLILDNTGKVLAPTSNRGYPRDMIMFEMFNVHAQRDSGFLWIGKPVFDHTSRKWLIPLSRRISNPDGSFAGLAYAAIDASYFSKYYRMMHLGYEKQVVLVGYDGVVRASQYLDQSDAGYDISTTELFLGSQQALSGEFIGASVDGISRYYSYQKMLDYPLTIAIGVSSKDALARFQARRASYYKDMVLFTLFVITFFSLLTWQLWHRRKVENAIQQQNHLLLTLQDLSLRIVNRSDVRNLHQLIIDSLCALLLAPQGYLALPDNGSGKMTVKVTDSNTRGLIIRSVEKNAGIIGKAWASGNLEIVEDYRNWPDRLPYEELADKTTLVAIPLCSDNEIIGILGVCFQNKPRMISPEERSALEQFAAVAAIALQNAKTYVVLQKELLERTQAEEELQRRNKLLSFLNNTSLEIMNRRDVIDLLETIVNKAAEITGASTGSVLLFNDERTERIRVVATGPAGSMLGSRNPIDEGAAGQVWKTGKVVLVNDYKTWEHRSFPADSVAEAVVYFPLKSAGEVVGIIGLWHTQQGLRFEKADVEILDQLAGLASIAYENAFLYREAQKEITDRKQTETLLQYQNFHDSLTSLYNRTYFEEEMQRMDKRRSGSAGLIMLDLDGLKLINDTMGHERGDVLLATAAHILSASFRDSDVVARIGGDEFAVLLQPADEATIQAGCERIRQKTTDFNALQLQAPISLSIGYAVAADPSVPMRELFQRADNTMYREKLHRRQSTRSAIVQTVMKLLEARDYITEGHADRLQGIVARVGRALGFSDEKLSDLRLFAQFHDIGKVGIPDSILMKPGPLTTEEKTEMQRHSEIGQRIAQSAPDLVPIADWVLKHQEWWNGQGYPLGLSGEDIPLECRILSIADAYDAMTSDRPYRKALPHSEAIIELERCAGTQFDPSLVGIFVSLCAESIEVAGKTGKKGAKKL